MMTEHEKVVFVANGQIEAQQVQAFLEAAGVLSILRGESLTHTHGLSVSELGKVEVLVASSDEERANELLASVERGEFQLDDDDEAEEPGTT
jgi:hypothetical protein